jgi:hypothetical protein
MTLAFVPDDSGMLAKTSVSSVDVRRTWMLKPAGRASLQIEASWLMVQPGKLEGFPQSLSARRWRAWMVVEGYKNLGLGLELPLPASLLLRLARSPSSSNSDLANSPSLSNNNNNNNNNNNLRSR